MSFLTEIKRHLKSKIVINEKMSRHTTYGIGGIAKYYAEPESINELVKLINLLSEYNVPYVVIGCGSNILVSDKGIDSFVINTKKLRKIEVAGEKIKAESGVRLNDLVEFCSKRELSGLEFLTNIPATVGGATTMNAGAFNSSISKHITHVHILENGKETTLKREDCWFSYRESRFKNSKAIILSVTFNLFKSERDKIEEKIEKYREKRKNQPKGKSCGSVFKNDNIYVGKLIDMLGLKGTRIGGAVISKEHGNFIVNDNNATAKDVYSLIEYIKKIVNNSCGIKLSEEVIYLGEKDDFIR